MKIEFVRNVQFSKLVKVEGQLREFNFRKVNTPNEETFTVDYNDERNRRIVFNLRKEDNTWKVVPSPEVPDSITNNAVIFHDVVEAEFHPAVTKGH